MHIITLVLCQPLESIERILRNRASHDIIIAKYVSFRIPLGNNNKVLMRARY